MTVKESNEEKQKPSPSEAKELVSPASAKDVVLSNEDESESADAEPPFPVQLLEELEEMVQRVKWVVPVQPDAQLQELMRAATELAKKGLDTKSSACQRFFRDGLTSSFNKILTDDAVTGWKPEIQRYIYYNCKDLVELCAAKIKDNWIILLDLLAMVLNPNIKFHSHNYGKPSETVPLDKAPTVEVVYARPDPRMTRGYLIDSINHFGNLNGFIDLRDHLCETGENLSVSTIAACIRPFGHCAEYLTEECVQEFLMPCVDRIVDFLDGLSDADLKKESKNEARTDTFSQIIRSCRNLCLRCPAREGMPQRLEEVCLQLYLRLLQTSSFNGKMNAINEINKMINSLSGYRHQDYSDWLTSARLAEWIQTRDVLSILLRDNLHQPQYVEKLERIVRYVIKEKMMSLKDLDNIWAAQAGKHEAIVKNVHDLLAHLAWDFSAEQLDHLFQCFQASWVSASKKGREKLLELIRRLAEDDKEGMMAGKVLKLLWNLAHDEDCPPEIMDQALSSLVKILDYSCSQESEQQKMGWIMDCVGELRSNQWVLPALKLIKDISSVFPPPPAGMSQPRTTVRHNVYRNEALSTVNTDADLLTLVCNNLCQYMESVRVRVGVKVDELDPDVYSPDGRYTHVAHLQERLNFIRYVLRDGQLWLVGRQAQQIWKCLAENAVFPADRGICFRWFSKLLGDEPDLDPESTCGFMEENVLKLDPSVLTEAGLKCFERFFRVVNQNLRRMTMKRRRFITETMDLIGLDYLWQVILHGPDEVVSQAIHLLMESVTNLGTALLQDMAAQQKPFLAKCMETLNSSFDQLQSAKKAGKSTPEVEMVHVTHMVRCLTLLKEFIGECDSSHRHERTIPLHSRAVRGRQLTFIIRSPSAAHHQVIEDFEITTHTNELIASVRRKILAKLKMVNVIYQVDLFIGNELVTSADDKKLVFSLPLRDRSIITAKPIQSTLSSSNLASTTSTIPSSPDSSSEDSNGSGGVTSKGPNTQLEQQLPGVIISQNAALCNFLISLADYGIANNHPALRDSVRNLLKIMPSDTNRVMTIRMLCNTDGASAHSEGKFNSLFFSNGPAKALYNLEITLSLLMPSHYTSDKDLLDFQEHFIAGGGIACMLRLLNGRDKCLVNADPVTRRSCFQAILKICKFMLTVVAYARLSLANQHSANEAVDAEGNVVGNAEPAVAPLSPAAVLETSVLQAALDVTPNPASEYWMRTIAKRLGTICGKQAGDHNPSETAMNSVVRMVWAAAAGSVHLCIEQDEDIHGVFVSGVPAKAVADLDDVNVAKEGLEVLTLCAALNPDVFFQCMPTSKMWQQFISDVLFLCRPRSIRSVASDQLQLMATQCSARREPLMALIDYLFQLLSTTANEHATFALQYFTLLCRLLNVAGARKYLSSENVAAWVAQELDWLTSAKTRMSRAGEEPPTPLLEGHLGITSELISLQTPEVKFKIGSDPNGIKLIETIIFNFLFASSKLVLEAEGRESNGDKAVDQSRPVCSTSQSQTAAFDLLVVLTTGCKENLHMLCDLLTRLFYADSPGLSEWEYLPPVGPRPLRGFVGLKNAGATCYMNSVLQSLFMIPPIRNCIIRANNAGWDDQDEQMTKSTKEQEQVIPYSNEVLEKSATPPDSPGGSRKDYNTSVLRHVQHIFGHLLGSQLQFHTPQGFWKTFRLWGEAVNLREQHDALEFFNSLVDSIDEALKTLGHRPAVVDTLGGSFADQKICKGCPHRYAREEPFTSLNVDVRNHQHLLESLEQYVKGDLLEGANAYHCEKCDKKVDTVKRLCIKKLPQVLAIQLKRFDYDWERECAVKFNDYFEFPREFDMEPFTVQGLAKVEGEEIRCEVANGDKAADSSEPAGPPCTRYRLAGLIVHSGQASGGHYYAFILQRTPDGQPDRWYRFDDNEVTECKMEDEEEMKAQCFGGEYMADVFDHMTKRMAYRRQKRWWNAYILFYEREDAPITVQKDWLAPGVALSEQCAPQHIQMSVQRENLHYSHLRMHFCSEYFQFIKKLVLANSPARMRAMAMAESEEVPMLCIQLASAFLFSVGLRSKKSLRGPAMEWYDCLQALLVASAACRRWFAANVLFKEPERFSQYLLECPSAEVRTAFCKLLVMLTEASTPEDMVVLPAEVKNVTPASSDIIQAVGSEPVVISDAIIRSVLSMLRHQVVDHSKHVHQYFQFFTYYGNMGLTQRKHLMTFDVPAALITSCLELGARVQYIDLSKLHAVVAHLFPCYDVTHLQRSAKEGCPVMANPLADPDMQLPMPKAMETDLFSKNRYLKRLIEEGSSSDEVIKLLQFLCWENPTFSHAVLTEILLQLSYVYTHEMKAYMDLAMHMMLMNDSWQVARITNVMKGFSSPSDRSLGLFSVIQHNKTHYQKRAYLCLKCCVTLFTTCPVAVQLFETDLAIRSQYTMAMEWLNEEMSHAHGAYTQWATGQSNEAGNGYYLERSNSARTTLAKGLECLPAGEEQLTDEADTSADISEVIPSSPLRQDSNDVIGSGENDSEGEMIIRDDVDDALKDGGTIEDLLRRYTALSVRNFTSVKSSRGGDGETEDLYDYYEEEEEEVTGTDDEEEDTGNGEEEEGTDDGDNQVGTGIDSNGIDANGDDSNGLDDFIDAMNKIRPTVTAKLNAWHGSVNSTSSGSVASSCKPKPSSPASRRWRVAEARELSVLKGRGKSPESDKDSTRREHAPERPAFIIREPRQPEGIPAFPTLRAYRHARMADQGDYSTPLPVINAHSRIPAVHRSYDESPRQATVSPSCAVIEETNGCHRHHDASPPELVSSNDSE
ncbi:probable ubiquitin carboxyl-terminal hydrolase FAF-X isoform X1 [Sycon ciliatum]|uniref:probable ubiquitin carboxyl-terminal hydrolase FAF-X isoform X1 n=1 Tax=Sycon ciliatum TaxID=27933 RepID=UPI0031F70418